MINLRLMKWSTYFCRSPTPKLQTARILFPAQFGSYHRTDLAHCKIISIKIIKTKLSNYQIKIIKLSNQNDKFSSTNDQIIKSK